MRTLQDLLDKHDALQERYADLGEPSTDYEWMQYDEKRADLNEEAVELLDAIIRKLRGEPR